MSLSAPRHAASAWILETQHAAIIVIGEELGIAAPIDHGLEHFGRLLLAQMIFELGEEAPFRRAVAGTLVEHLADMRGERNAEAELLGKDLLPVLHLAFGEGAADRRHPDVAAADLREAQKLQRLDEHEERVIVDMLALGEMRQVGAARIRRDRKSVV